MRSGLILKAGQTFAWGEAFGGLLRAQAPCAAGRLLAALAVVLGFSMPGSAQQSVVDFDGIVQNAAAARSQGDLGRATELYEQAVALRPQWPDGWWFLGTLRYGADQFVPARDALSRYIDLKPNAGPALALRGLCEFEIGQYPESLADLERGIALGAAEQPRNGKIVLYHEALLLTRLGSFEKAIGRYTNFVNSVDPGNASDELTAAIGLAGLRMPVFPKDADPAQAQLIAMTGAAGIKMMTGDTDGGGQAFDEVFERFPAAPNVHYFYGYLLFAKRPEASVAQFQKELAIAPGSAAANAMLAWAYGLQLDYADALPVAEAAAREDPSLAIGQLMAGRALVETGDPAAGLPHLETALRLEPGSLEAHLTLAKAYSKLGKKDDARRERQMCLQIAGEGAGPGANP